MNHSSIFNAAIVVAACLAPATLRAEDAPDSIAELEAAAAAFIVAYNNRDADAIAAMFTENGEITDMMADDVTTGRAAIKERYAQIFAEDDAPAIAIEVDSVRLVGANLAIEDGVAHFSVEGDPLPFRSIAYTAVLQKNEAGTWQIASNRTLREVTGPGGRLTELAEFLKGDWTAQVGDLRVDMAFGWDDTGKFMIGELLALTPDGEPITSSVRLGWDGARNTITSWTFDSKGGFAQADWTRTDSGFTVHTKGTTSDGEARSATQYFAPDGRNTILLSITDRTIDGEPLPDAELRIARRPPSPASN
jgi:uncharacterized protein (TIGR02246 family)